MAMIFRRQQRSAPVSLLQSTMVLTLMNIQRCARSLKRADILRDIKFAERLCLKDHRVNLLTRTCCSVITHHTEFPSGVLSG